ncbi:MAG: asparagine synthase (glutamine-hydrolyzing) [Verrucomicrobia bacterium]|nr:asparagine synthase (glutamine-hydrolyzing) [Cytophagales bacterium]
MCGITGFFSFQQPFSENQLKQMTGKLAHRGPDAEGFFFDGLCGLGHRRLSIIDLSSNANQPMTSANGQFMCVFNGEIYNFKEIRSDLEKEGVVFKTQSDTEVLLENFVKNGVESFEKLNGIFAFAIYDKLKEQLIICRDRLGIKPLYYFHQGTALAFASEIKALLTLPQVSKTISKTALADFLHLGYIPSDSIFSDIKKLPAACYAVLNENNLKINTYWQMAEKITANVIANETQALAELDVQLRRSVDLQMVADVPLGVFLSGGIDSSVVATMASQVSATQIKTFSIGFEEEKFNEAPFAKAVAGHLQTDHHELIVTAKQAQNLVIELIDVFDEPFADSSAIPTMLVSALARKHVAVALSGDGGDELFFGYGSYNWATRLQKPLLKKLYPIMAPLMAFGKKDSFRKAANMFRLPESNLTSHIFSQEQGFFSQQEVNNLLNQTSPFHPESEVFNRSLSAMEKQAFFDLNYYLPEDLLVKVDRASMRYGLEVRVPLLDHDLVTWALNLSPDLKYKQGIRKYLLKKVLYQYVPEKLFDRPKRGFAIPLAKWLTTDLKFLIDEFLDEKLVRQAGLVNSERVERLKNQFLKGGNFIYNKIWILIVLHQFAKKHL